MGSHRKRYISKRRNVKKKWKRRNRKEEMGGTYETQKTRIAAALLIVLLSALGLHAAYSFNHSGLEQALAGLAEEDKYPNWDSWNGSEKNFGLTYEIVSKSGLYFSKIYFLERANHYQVRFRIGYKIPFMHQDLFNDIWWVLEDSEGNSYTQNIVVYTEKIAGLNCTNVTLVLEKESVEFSGKQLNITAVCSKEGNAKADTENSYAHCKVKLLFP